MELIAGVFGLLITLSVLNISMEATRPRKALEEINSKLKEGNPNG